jgi:hypothetical protein
MSLVKVFKKLLLPMVLLLSTLGYAQTAQTQMSSTGQTVVSNGVQPLVSGGGNGNYDFDGIQPGVTMVRGVDLSTLDVAVSIPLVSKKGSGLDFSAALLFHNNWLFPNGSSGWSGWSNSNSFGWSNGDPVFGSILGAQQHCTEGTSRLRKNSI